MSKVSLVKFDSFDEKPLANYRPPFLDSPEIIVYLAPADEIENIEEEIQAQMDIANSKEPKRWVAFAPTSYRQGKIKLKLILKNDFVML